MADSNKVEDGTNHLARESELGWNVRDRPTTPRPDEFGEPTSAHTGDNGSLLPSSGDKTQYVHDGDEEISDRDDERKDLDGDADVVTDGPEESPTKRERSNSDHTQDLVCEDHSESSNGASGTGSGHLRNRPPWKSDRPVKRGQGVAGTAPDVRTRPEDMDVSSNLDIPQDGLPQDGLRSVATRPSTLRCASSISAPSVPSGERDVNTASRGSTPVFDESTPYDSVPSSPTSDCGTPEAPSQPSGSYAETNKYQKDVPGTNDPKDSGVSTGTGPGFLQRKEHPEKLEEPTEAAERRSDQTGSSQSGTDRSTGSGLHQEPFVLSPKERSRGRGPGSGEKRVAPDTSDTGPNQKERCYADAVKFGRPGGPVGPEESGQQEKTQEVTPFPEELQQAIKNVESYTFLEAWAQHRLAYCQNKKAEGVMHLLKMCRTTGLEFVRELAAINAFNPTVMREAAEESAPYLCEGLLPQREQVRSAQHLYDDVMKAYHLTKKQRYTPLSIPEAVEEGELEIGYPVPGGWLVPKAQVMGEPSFLKPKRPTVLGLPPDGPDYPHDEVHIHSEAPEPARSCTTDELITGVLGPDATSLKELEPEDGKDGPFIYKKALKEMLPRVPPHLFSIQEVGDMMVEARAKLPTALRPWFQISPKGLVQAYADDPPLRYVLQEGVLSYQRAKAKVVKYISTMLRIAPYTLFLIPTLEALLRMNVEVRKIYATFFFAELIETKVDSSSVPDAKDICALMDLPTDGIVPLEVSERRTTLQQKRRDRRSETLKELRTLHRQFYEEHPQFLLGKSGHNFLAEITHQQYTGVNEDETSNMIEEECIKYLGHPIASSSPSKSEEQDQADTPIVGEVPSAPNSEASMEATGSAHSVSSESEVNEADPTLEQWRTQPSPSPFLQYKHQTPDLQRELMLPLKEARGKLVWEVDVALPRCRFETSTIYDLLRKWVLTQSEHRQAEENKVLYRSDRWYWWIYQGKSEKDDTEQEREALLMHSSRLVYAQKNPLSSRFYSDGRPIRRGRPADFLITQIPKHLDEPFKVMFNRRLSGPREATHN